LLVSSLTDGSAKNAGHPEMEIPTVKQLQGEFDTLLTNVPYSCTQMSEGLDIIDQAEVLSLLQLMEQAPPLERPPDLYQESNCFDSFSPDLRDLNPHNQSFIEDSAFMQDEESYIQPLPLLGRSFGMDSLLGTSLDPRLTKIGSLIQSKSFAVCAFRDSLGKQSSEEFVERNSFSTWKTLEDPTSKRIK
jgi:hypothetical protein